ncbi:MAG: AAA family ATPase [Promethearchaeota archaeon]
MILESIEIKNIRSIQSEAIEFPSSTLLFFGDVGSGKSSVLKSIEFALFGTLIHGDLSGDSLLRRGKTKASVNLTFSIEGKKFSIKRSLFKDKKGRVSQKECKFVDHNKGTTTTYAPTDMRRKILELLSYSVSRYEKATKLPLFRYTVYTPQEQIKDIIQADPDDRFEILKEVFGIEKYEIALRNAETIKEFLNDIVKEIQIKIKQIGEPEEEILLKEKEIEETKKNINKKETEIKEKGELIASHENSIEGIQKELDNYIKNLNQIENKEKTIKKNKGKQLKSKSSLNEIKNEIFEREEELKNLKEVKPNTKSNEDELESQMEIIQNLKSQKEKEKAVIEKILADIDKLLEDGKCALCGQAIHEKERFEEELQDARSKFELLTKEIRTQTLNIEEKKQLLKNLREYHRIKDKKESLNTLISETRKRKADLENRINEFFIEINNNQQEIIGILSEFNNTSLQKFKIFGDELKSKLDKRKKSLKELNSKREMLGNESSAQKKALEYLQKDLVSLNTNIVVKKTLENNLSYYSQLRNWIAEEFPILIRDIEKNILSSSAYHFNSYFKEWFHELVEDRNIEVEIKTDDFQPIIHVNGYESPFKDLSGGEKSALSLAYRLALNKIINERYQEVKTKDLLILDEPTDGFSQQQINRMQSIFENLNTSQMIIISHERNLDSFVTDIFHFKKENHLTRVLKLNS